jgi:hypothetical protein
MLAAPPVTYEHFKTSQECIAYILDICLKIEYTVEGEDVLRMGSPNSFNV